MNRRDALRSLLGIAAPAIAVPFVPDGWVRRAYSFLWAPTVAPRVDAFSAGEALKLHFSKEKIRALTYMWTAEVVDRAAGIITLSAGPALDPGDYIFRTAITGLRDVDTVNFETGMRVTLT